MATWDAADLLARCQRLTRVPASTNFPTSTDWYAWMTDAQLAIKNDLAVEVPDAMMGAPTLMSSADGGYTYTFGTDAQSNAIFPIGKVQIYQSLASIPTSPYVPGQDYLMEGTQIRWTNNQKMPAPYGRWVTPPLVIDGSTQPTIPLQARMLIVYFACATYAASGGQQDPTPYLNLYNFHRDQVVTSFKKQFLNQGAIASLRRPGVLPYVRR